MHSALVAMPRTERILYVWILTATLVVVAACAGAYAGARFARVQPCVSTSVQDGHRVCVLDERDGAWVR